MSLVLLSEESLQQLDLFVLHDALAVDAAKGFELHVEDLHLGGDGLVVGDALRVAALHYADDLLGVLHVLLLDDLIVLDDVEGDKGSDD